MIACCDLEMARDLAELLTTANDPEAYHFVCVLPDGSVGVYGRGDEYPNNTTKEQRERICQNGTAVEQWVSGEVRSRWTYIGEGDGGSWRAQDDDVVSTYYEWRKARAKKI